MSIMTCRTCTNEFQGRPNRLYCSPNCRRKAEMAIRERKKEELRQAMMASMNPEERAFYDCCREWVDNFPTIGEVFEDLTSIEDLFGDLQPLNWPTIEDLWPGLKHRKGRGSFLVGG